MGSRNKKANPVYIDFETGESKIDSISERRQIQDQLYRLDNPYVGNKRGILVDIADALDKNDVKFEQVIDLFSGSGVVSTFFKLLGKTVVSNDLLTSSYYNAVAFSENNTFVLNDAEREWLCKNDNPNKGDFVRTAYADRFTPEEALFLDNYRANVDTFIDQSFAAALHASRTSPFGPNSGVLARSIEIAKAVCILTVEHYVLNRCFLGGRLNKGQVLADLDHRLAHDRNKGDSMRFTLDPLPFYPYLEEDLGTTAYNLDALAAAAQARSAYPGLDFAYIDPPYGGPQSDYTQMFAFCEEYVYGAKIDTLPHLDVCKKFVTKKDYEKNFRDVLDAMKWVPTWGISYNATSFKDIEGIKSLIGDYKKDIVLVDIAHEYRYRKDRGEASEYLIIAR